MTTSTPIPDALAEKSAAYCEDLTRRQARNFYYGLKLLPEPKRSAMYALYAYMRLVDDIADEEDQRDNARRAADLAQWRDHTLAVIAGDDATIRKHIVWPAFADLVARYKIPTALFEDMIEGQRQDLEPVAIPDFPALYAYCYRVASVVGLASIHVWGFTGGKETEELAVKRGIAFQLTNVLRDLREDAARGRCYLPADELARCNVPERDIANARGGPNFIALMRMQIARARQFYAESEPLESRITPDCQPTLAAMTAIYRGILERIAENPERVLHERVALGKLAKLRIAWQAWWAGRAARNEAAP